MKSMKNHCRTIFERGRQRVSKTSRDGKGVCVVGAQGSIKEALAAFKHQTRREGKSRKHSWGAGEDIMKLQKLLQESSSGIHSETGQRPRRTERRLGCGLDL